ncbi:MAG: hypothetical protein P8X65_12520 [Syntrophobacterales bacterium]|jgi:hypothetical protein
MLTSKVKYVLILAGAAFLISGAFPLVVQAQTVHFKELMSILAIAPPKDWKVSEKPKGKTLKSPVQVSEAEVEFKSGDDKKIEIKIVDGLGSMLPFMSMAQGMEMESSEEYMKPIEVQGFKGTEKFEYKDKKGEIILPVANRFMVTIEGEGIDNNDVIKEVAGKLDLKKLAGMAK